MVGLKKKTVTYAKISPKVVNSRDITGERTRRKRRSLLVFSSLLPVQATCTAYIKDRSAQIILFAATMIQQQQRKLGTSSTHSDARQTSPRPDPNMPGVWKSRHLNGTF